MDSLENALGPILLIACSFAIAKVLISFRIINNENANSAGKFISIGLGIAYGLYIDPNPSRGIAIDFILKIVAGSFLAIVSWVFVMFGLGIALGDDKEKASE